MKLEFDPAADAAYFEISSAEVETSKEIEAGIIVDYDKHGHVIGVEVGCPKHSHLLHFF